jgi:nucleotide-binding universal stress UspA family protein
MRRLTKILVPTDFEPGSELALEMAVDLAMAFDGSIRLVHAFELPVAVYAGAAAMSFVDYTPEARKIARDAVNAQATRFRARFPRIEATWCEGSPWREILASADDLRADLIVMGTHGRRGLSRALLGSVAEKIVRLATMPVLTVRAPTRD